MPTVRLACQRCNRRGQYRLARLIAEHGPDVLLPDLRHVLAAPCPHIGNRTVILKASCTMKIAIISDLHIPHSGHQWQWIADGIRASIDEVKPDLLIDAGDMMADPDQIEQLRAEWRVPMISVRGNHDYYHKTWFGPQRDCHSYGIDGLRIAATTLWMDFDADNPLTHEVVGRCLNDFRLIGNFTTRTALAAHRYQKKFLQDAFAKGVDIVVTHHCPSFRSIHDKYKTPGSEHLNHGFASNADDLVEACGARLWVHGHTHCPCDYVIGRTRVICNPLGYPGENPGPYVPVYCDVRA